MKLTVQDRERYLADEHGKGVRTIENVTGAHETKNHNVSYDAPDGGDVISQAVIIGVHPDEASS